MESNYEKLMSLVESLQTDIVKFYEKGNNAAGSRVRKAMQEVKTLAQDIRIDIQDQKKIKKESM